MRRSIGKNWLWLAGGAAIATILAILPMPGSAEADTVTICVSKSGLIKGININDSHLCKPNATPVTWELFGPTGATGPIGVKGPQGPDGVQGPVGSLGPVGNPGPQGGQGAPGVQGPHGLTGPTGPTGAQGDQGEEGPPNLTEFGPTGATGAAGVTGATGPVGDQGQQGQTGQQGPPGLDTEDIVYLTGGTLGHQLGNGLNIELTPDLAFLVLAPGNGSSPESHTPADTWIPMPDSSVGTNHFPRGVYENFRIRIFGAPGGTNGGHGSYLFRFVDMTTAQTVDLCTIVDPAVSCTNLEEDTALAIVTNANDLVALEGLALPNPQNGVMPTNHVDVMFSAGYVHCNGGDAACPP